jgi:hypothetical protein
MKLLPLKNINPVMSKILDLVLTFLQQNIADYSILIFIYISYKNQSHHDSFRFPWTQNFLRLPQCTVPATSYVMRDTCWRVFKIFSRLWYKHVRENVCLVVGGACECDFHFVVMVCRAYMIRKACVLLARRLVPCCSQRAKRRRSVGSSYHGRALWAWKYMCVEITAI